MTGVVFDLKHSGTDDVFLGGCDLENRSNPTEKDRILSWNGSKWVWNFETEIPNRKNEKGWGTVYLTAADLNQTGNTDIVALTHDLGFHKGIPQILLRSNHSSKINFQDSKISNWPSILQDSHNYLHRVVTYDLDNDGHLDLVGQISYIDNNHVIRPNVFVLMNKKNRWEYVTNVFDISKNDHVIGINKLKLKGQKNESLLFIFYNGDIKIF